MKTCLLFFSAAYAALGQCTVASPCVAVWPGAITITAVIPPTSGAVIQSDVFTVSCAASQNCSGTTPSASFVSSQTQTGGFAVLRNGVIQSPITDYNVNGSAVIFEPSSLPVDGDTVVLVYSTGGVGVSRCVNVPCDGTWLLEIPIVTASREIARPLPAAGTNRGLVLRSTRKYREDSEHVRGNSQ